MSRTPASRSWRSSSHTRSITRLGSPVPTIATEPWSTPRRTGPVRYTPVFHVHAGPRVSSAALVVTSLKTEAGFTPKSGFQPQDGAAASTGCTHSASALLGTWALASAAAMAGGNVHACAGAMEAPSTAARARVASRIMVAWACRKTRRR